MLNMTQRQVISISTNSVLHTDCYSVIKNLVMMQNFEVTKMLFFIPLSIATKITIKVMIT